MNQANIAIVTDSTADIPNELAAKYRIHIVLNIIVIDGQSLEDGKDISRREFYENLPKMKSTPTTATASQGVYLQLYNTLFDQGYSQIISIHPPPLLSGIFNATSVAAQEFKNRVHVIDSQQVSLGLGFQVLAAAEAIMRGASLEDVLALVENVRSRVRLVAMVDTLEYLRRSGRVSWARARLGGLLRIKPFIEVKTGQILSLGEVRTHRKGVARLLKMLRNLGSLDRLAILHSNAEGEARQLLADLSPQSSTEPLVVNITPIIGSHVGPNGLGFAVVLQK